MNEIKLWIELLFFCWLFLVFLFALEKVVNWLKQILNFRKK